MHTGDKACLVSTPGLGRKVKLYFQGFPKNRNN